MKESLPQNITLNGTVLLGLGVFDLPKANVSVHLTPEIIEFHVMGADIRVFKRKTIVCSYGCYGESNLILRDVVIVALF